MPECVARAGLDLKDDREPPGRDCFAFGTVPLKKKCLQLSLALYKATNFLQITSAADG